MTPPLHVAVLGLGEAGAAIAADLAARGATVSAIDPSPVSTPGGVRRCDQIGDVLDGADVVMALTPEAACVGVAKEAAPHLDPGVLYAECSTASAATKQEVAAVIGAHDHDDDIHDRVIDVALMAPVPGRGVATPTLLSGPNAARLLGALRPYGFRGDVVSGDVGDAAARKLLRSVFMKGLAQVVLEALDGAHAAGCGEWMRDDIEAQLTAADAALVERLVDGTQRHAARRLDEMRSALDVMDGLGVDAAMTRATVERLTAQAR